MWLSWNAPGLFDLSGLGPPSPRQQRTQEATEFAATMSDQQQGSEKSPKKSGVRIQELIESEAQEISLGRRTDEDHIVARTAALLQKVGSWFLH